MSALLGFIAPLKRYGEIAISVLLIVSGIWVYLALVHRAEQIQTLTAANSQLMQANADGVAAVQAEKDQLERTTAALTAEKQAATDNAALSGQLQERISHAPKNGCIGPAMRGVLDGLRDEAADRRRQVRPAVAP